jgi:hypothetical protein
MTEISHVKGSDNVVADVLSRYPEETGQSYDHLLPDEHDMDLVCAHFFNLSSGLSMDDFGSLSQDDTVPHVDPSLKGNGAHLLDSSTVPRASSDNVLEDLTFPLNPVSKLCLDGYDLSLVSADVETNTFTETYPQCPDFQKQFETLSQYTGDVRHPTFPDFSVRNGVLHFLDGVRSRVCVPTNLRGQFLETCHDSPLGGHVGTKKLKYTMMTQFYWPHMATHIEKYVALCEHCPRNKNFNASTRDIPHPHDVHIRRFEVMSLDVLSGFPTSKNGYDCIVAFTDRLSKSVFISPCHKTSSAKDLDVIFFQTVFRQQGMPHILLSDNDPQFISEFWREV